MGALRLQSASSGIGFRSICVIKSQSVARQWWCMPLILAFEKQRQVIPEFKASLVYVCDVGFPSVCCEYHWLIKILAWPDRVE